MFPNAPGINPSFTIMALASMAGERILKDAHETPAFRSRNRA